MIKALLLSVISMMIMGSLLLSIGMITVGLKKIGFYDSVEKKLKSKLERS